MKKKLNQIQTISIRHWVRDVAAIGLGSTWFAQGSNEAEITAKMKYRSIIRYNLVIFGTVLHWLKNLMKCEILDTKNRSCCFFSTEQFFRVLIHNSGRTHNYQIMTKCSCMVQAITMQPIVFAFFNQHVPKTCHMRQHKDPDEHNERRNETPNIVWL